jgi:DNA-binding NarL/FixJ family response regulator
VHIEHDGVSNYFPLGTMDTAAAGGRAAAIHQTVVERGWEAAYASFPREVTIALHWVTNPVTWTYTTFHTEPRSPAPAPARAGEAVLRVALIEPDGGVRRALQHLLEARAGVRCVAAHATPDDVFKQATPNRKQLWLVNRSLPGMAGNECLDRMRRSVAGLCGLIYSVYEDSNQLFLATPGGATAYLLKRTPPEQLLEPVLAQGAFEISPGEVLSRVRHYYAPCLDFAPADEQARALENVTPREYEILELLSKGYLDKEIAARLKISGWTVRGHLKNIFEKLNVHTRTEAVVKFLHK